MADRIIASEDARSIPPSVEVPQSRLPLVTGEIRIDADASMGWTQYTGTAVQLIEEGLIPYDFEWPRGKEDSKWVANGFRYWLRRTRPENHKGPMSSWLQADNWEVRVRVVGRDSAWLARRALARKAEALEAEMHLHTAAGSREWMSKWKRYDAATQDKSFQAFKSIFVPQRKKPGRKPKCTDVQAAGKVQ